MWKSLVAVITFLGGLFFAAEFAIPKEIPLFGHTLVNPLTRHYEVAGKILLILTAMAFLLGPINLMKAHVGIVARRRESRTVILCSVTFLVCFVIGLVAIWPQWWWPEIAADSGSGWNILYKWLLDGFSNSFGITSMAILTFYLISAAFRSFRLHSLDAGLMMISALIVLLGMTPIGAWATHGLAGGPLRWLQLPVLTDWILSTPNTGVQRAVVFGVCAGAFATGMRHWLSLGTAKAD
jgi:hypothetical protein